MSDTELRKDLTPEEFSMFRDWIHKHSGIFLEDIKIDSLRISLVTRATRLGYTGYDEYFAYLSGNEDEFKELMNLVTINETSFFRFPQQFDAMRDRVIPEILERKPITDRAFRVWSAGCSTGEEPYTIGMTALDSIIPQTGRSIEVVGSDVSTQALDKARSGIYPSRSLNNLSANTINRWFEPEGRDYRVVQRVRDLCSFHYHNLIREPYPVAFLGGWDIILCRNVTIYFQVESTKRVVQHYFDALNPGGYLFIGHSETLSTVSDRFEPVEIGGVFLYRKPLNSGVFAVGALSSHRAPTPAAGPRPRASALSSADPASGSRTTRTVKRDVRPARPTPQIRPATPQASAMPREGVDSEGKSVQSLLVKAHEMLECADTREALSFALSALELDPRNVDARCITAFAYVDSGDFDSAAEHAESALRANPLTASARYILGMIKRRQGDSLGAITEFKRTVYIDPDFVLAHFDLAGLYRQGGDVPQARREYENTLRALHASPDGEWTLFLGGFSPEVLGTTCERSLIECKKGR